MKPQKERIDEEKKKDILDHLEDFIETRIEKNLKKGLDEVEKFVKEELLKGASKKKDGKGGKPGALSYIEAFLEDPQVAAVIPSTKFIVDRVLKMIDWEKAKTIVEYGPAEGVMTRRMLERLPEDGVLFAIETNPRFVAALGNIQDPRLTVLHGSVLDIEKLLAPHQVGAADAIVSGIPFSFLKPIERHQLLHRTEERLHPGGRFIAYQVTTHLLPLLKYHFQDVDVQYELRNIPPHFIFTGFK